MTFYAVAVGREQKIVESWFEARRLTYGYPSSKFKKFNTITEAERWLNNFNYYLIERNMTGYEEELRMIPSFANKNFSIPAKQTYLIQYSKRITIEGKKYKHKELKIEVKDNDIKRNYSVIILCSPKQIDNLRLEKTETFKDTPIYYYSIYVFSELDGLEDLNQLTLRVLADTFLTLKRNSLTDIRIDTNLNYLINVLKTNLFESKYLSHFSLANSDPIGELYRQLGKMNSVYLNYFSDKVMSSNYKLAEEVIKRDMEGLDE